MIETWLSFYCCAYVWHTCCLVRPSSVRCALSAKYAAGPGLSTWLTIIHLNQTWIILDCQCFSDLNHVESPTIEAICCKTCEWIALLLGGHELNQCDRVTTLPVVFYCLKSSLWRGTFLIGTLLEHSFL